LQFADEVISHIAAATGAKVLARKQFRLSPELCDKHYAHIADKPFYMGTREYMLSGDCIGVILARENGDLVGEVKKIVGDTKGETAGTIRNHYMGLMNEKIIWKNVLHCSGKNENETDCRRFAEILGIEL
jgi:nucleoside-diphosphate kinase